MFKPMMLFATVVVVGSPAFAQPAPAESAPAAEASVAVPREVLERYVGRYALNGALVTVSVTEDGRLLAQLDGQPPGPPLRAVSENEFVADAVGVRLWFEGEGPQATRIRSRYAGAEAIGTRIPEGADVAAAVAAGARMMAPPPPDPSLARYISTKDAVRLPDGRMLNFVCMGEGSPTVILTPGMGDFSGFSWRLVHAQMATTTKVCAWDRPGYGMSDGSPVPQTVATTAADLEAALATGRIPGPYVMVGHSLGAYESLLFADRQRDRVVGMVLVDPSFPGQFVDQPPPPPGVVVSTPADRSAVLRQCAADIRSGALQPGAPDPNNCLRFPPNYSVALSEALTAKALANPLQFESQASFAQSGEEGSRIVLNEGRNYGAMPLIVLSAEWVPPRWPPGISEEVIANVTAGHARIELGHQALAKLSSGGVLQKVADANHYIQHTRPQVVIDAVEEVVGESRATD